MNTKRRLNKIISLGALLLLVVGYSGCASSGPLVTEERKFI